MRAAGAASPRTTRILGLDPGLRSTGFGLIDIQGGRLRYIASGCIRSNSGEALPARLGTLLDGVREIIAAYQPGIAVVEKVFVNVNPQSTLLLGQARGAVICGAVSCRLPVTEYTALQVKQAVVGHGKASKEQVQHMVMRLLALPAAPQLDAADALACAICHAHGSTGLGALAGPHIRQRKGRLLALPPAKPALPETRRQYPGT
ncbi:MAG: crossover junction endodeoxyribonuclease RuvC [Azoarcus sp.]|jgi:crossover junction endodeoxyribonuclease RuvC|nr:crossover junction endodeoxyribonuclease RuvC [Azoarcus sp.]